MSTPYYSETKIKNMSTALRLRSIHKLLFAIDLHIADADMIQNLCGELSKFLCPELPLNLQELITNLCAATSPHQMINFLIPYLELMGETRKDSQIIIRQRDAIRNPDPIYTQKAKQIVVILDNLRSVFNVGSIFRSSECLSLSSLYLCGITPTPEHPNLAKTAMGTTEHIPWKYYSHTETAIEELKLSGYTIYALETTVGATSVFTSEFVFPLALVLGNESLGIRPEILSMCNHCIDLPVLGWKNSLNVGVAFASSAYQIVFHDQK